MKKYLHLAAIGIAALFAFQLTACSDDETTHDGPGPVGPSPSVKMEVAAGKSSTSVVFSLTATDADRAAWMILDRKAAAPGAETVLAEGHAVETDGTKSITVSELTPSTAYTLYAAAANGTTLSPVAVLEVETKAADIEYTELATLTETGKNSYTYHIEVAEGETYGHLGILKTVLDTFTGMATSDDQIDNMICQMLTIYGTVGTGPQDYTVRDLDAPAIGSKAIDVVAGLPYVVIACRIDAEKKFTGKPQVIEFTTSEPDLLSQTVSVQLGEVTRDEATLICTPDEGLLYYFEKVFSADQAAKLADDRQLLVEMVNTGVRTTEFGKPSEWVSLNEQTDYIHCAIGVDSDGNQTALVKTPFRTADAPAVHTEDLVFNQLINAIYYGQTMDDMGNDVYNYYIEIADCPVAKDDYGDYYPTDEGEGNILVADLYSAVPYTGGSIPQGEYHLSDTYEANSWNFDYTWARYFTEDGDYVDLEFSEGTITVEGTGADLRIVIDLTSPEGQRYTGTWTGDIAVDDQSSSAYSQPLQAKNRRVVRR